MRKARNLYMLKLSVKGVRPQVWRRILMPEASLADLHYIVQAVFGWQDYHLHAFVVDDVQYGDLDQDPDEEMGFRDESAVTFAKLGLKTGARFTYEYDFGDGWRHEIEVEAITPAPRGNQRPRCIAGARACPPEDVGGVGGYAEFLHALADPSHPEHDSYLEWAGGSFDSEVFDVDAADAKLEELSRKRWSEDARDPYAPPDSPSSLPSSDLGKWETAANSLALRRDTVTLISYLSQHKVTGTQSTGNLSLKSVEELAALMTDPQPLERKIGDYTMRVRSETDVSAVRFSHQLAVGAGLIVGGPGRRWRVSAAGDDFLASPATKQAWRLLVTWWYIMDWSLACVRRGYGPEMPREAYDVILTHLRTVSAAERPISLDDFATALVEDLGWSLPKGSEHASLPRSFVELMVVDPLRAFGVLSTEDETLPGIWADRHRPVSLAIAGFGRALLGGLRTKSELAKERADRQKLNVPFSWN